MHGNGLVANLIIYVESVLKLHNTLFGVHVVYVGESNMVHY